MGYGLSDHVAVGFPRLEVRAPGELLVRQGREQLVAVEGVVHPVLEKLLREVTPRVIVQDPEIRHPEGDDE